ncbi:autotransporter outer membrane beta-barrel domain-containing protein [Candidatus Tisiphia endosymbiont of Ditula angustiorana]|uniref:autotransporter outer membrane beta-barrel domain-containing protein n=1 Tax=Candidatus Tisiphia endosymbiont of Ditula angustiorana TaxID=3066272 RepID=UPI00312CB4D3
MCLSKVKILIAKVLFVIFALGTVIIIPVTVYGTGDSSRHEAVELFNTPLVINEKRTFEQFKKQLGVNRPHSYLTKVANFFCKKTQGQNEIPLEEMNVELTSSEFYDDIAPNEPYVDIEKTKKNQEDTTDGQQPIVPVANVPQQAGLEPAGEAPPQGGAGVPAPPAEAIAPQEKVAQVARVTAVLAEELLQKQKETVRNIALALNEIIILSHEFANSSIDLRLSDLRHLNNLSPPAAGDEDNIVPKNVWVSGTIGITKYNGQCLLSSYTTRTSATTIGGDLELPNGNIIGGAYNYVLSNFKYKNHTDKVAAHTHVISIYGQTNLSEKLILQGFLSRAFVNVSAKLPVQNQLAKAKFANSSYSSKIVVAYKSKVGKALIIPHIGLKYGGQDIAGYEASFEKQSLSVAATNSRRSSGLIGFEVIMPMKISDTTQVIPRFHMEVEKFLHNKQQKLHMQVMSYPSSKEEILLLEKPAKYNYKIGGTITIKRGSTEIMAVYNYLASNNKYSSHQGSLKLKLSF